MKLHRILLCCAALCGGVDAPRALAQGQPVVAPLMQVVRLNDGSIYQGELVELVPGDHLTIRLASGEVKRFAWSDMQPPTQPGVVPGVGPIPSVIAGVISGIPFTTPLSPPEPPDPVQLHFEASDPAAVLFATRDPTGLRFNGPTNSLYTILQDWTMVCPRAPCDVRADRRQIYSVQGPWIVRSLPFTLPQGNQVTATADVTHQGLRSFLTTMVVLGGGGIAAGMGLLIAGGVQETDSLDGNAKAIQDALDAKDRQHTLFVAGGIAMASGVALITAGLIAYRYARTNVNLTSDGHLAMQLPGKSQLDLSTMQVRF